MISSLTAIAWILSCCDSPSDILPERERQLREREREKEREKGRERERQLGREKEREEREGEGEGETEVGRGGREGSDGRVVERRKWWVEEGGKRDGERGMMFNTVNEKPTKQLAVKTTF